MVFNTEKHEPTDECAEVHCASCHRDEPQEGYRLCFECGHMYLTPQELTHAYNLEGTIPTDDPNKVFFCPLCLHDF